MEDPSIITKLPLPDKELYVIAKQMLKNGSSVDTVIQYLYDRGVNIVDTIHIITVVSRMKHRDVKEKVDSHPAWKAVSEASRELQETAWQVLSTGPNTKVTKNGIEIRLDD